MDIREINAGETNAYIIFKNNITMKHRFALLTLVLLVLSFFPASRCAVAQDAPPADEQDVGVTSLTFGFSSTDFRYADSDTLAAAAYNYDAALPTLMFSGRHGSLSLSYGTPEADSTTGQPALRVISAEAFFGGNARLFSEFLMLPVTVYIPIRLNLSYQYISADSTAPDNEPLPDLHLAGAGLGAGAGLRLALPIEMPFLNRIEVAASYVVAPGVMTNFGTGLDGGGREQLADRPPDRPSLVATSRESNIRARLDEEALDGLKLRRAADLNLEVRLVELFNDNLGMTLGYTYRTVERSPQPEEVGDVIDMILGEGRPIASRHLLRIGINW